MAGVQPRCGRRRAGALLVAGAMAALTCGWLSSAAMAERKPKLPGGQDPGGVAVALIGGGVDYTRSEYASRLARDGEGEPIAWDFVTSDRYPFARSPFYSEALTSLMLAEGKPIRLIAIAVGAQNTEVLPHALHFASQTPARIVLLAPELARPIAFENLASVAKQMQQALLVVPARLVAGPATTGPGIAANRHGLLIVASEAWAPQSSTAVADVVTGVPGGTSAAPDDLAAARIAALAARLIATGPQTDGAGLRARILGFARGAARDAPPTLIDAQRLP